MLLHEKKIEFFSIDSLVTKCVFSNPDTPIIFFVGSGVSTIFPSVLPSAHDIMSTTLQILSPKNQPSEGQTAQEQNKLSWMLQQPGMKK